ncbi:hypothetical protein [Mycolicibacterium pulveris]|uniref:hypothetical protein n=1 Tax=Mycolicibacterium pulveris TaxID=36813 RepID=UPI003CF9AB9C
MGLNIRSTQLLGVPVLFAALLVSAPPADALPESTIKRECQEANGSYHTAVIDGHRYSRCCYKDIDGEHDCDNYKDGEHTGSDSDIAAQQPSAEPTPPPLRPSIPVAPLPTAVNPR